MSDRPSVEAGLLETLRPLVAELVAEEVERRLVEVLREPTGKDLYTLAEAAEYLGCSPAAVRMRAKRGRLETRRHGRRVYVTGESLRKLAGGPLR